MKLQKVLAATLAWLIATGPAAANRIIEDRDQGLCEVFDLIYQGTRQALGGDFPELPEPFDFGYYGYRDYPAIRDLAHLHFGGVRGPCFKWVQCNLYSYQDPVIVANSLAGNVKKRCDDTLFTNLFRACSVNPGDEFDLEFFVIDADQCMQVGWVIYSLATQYGAQIHHIGPTQTLTGPTSFCSQQSCVFGVDTHMDGDRFARCWPSDPEPQCSVPRPAGWNNNHCMRGCPGEPSPEPVRKPGNDVSRDPNLDQSARNLMFALGFILLDIGIRIAGVLGFDAPEPGTLLAYPPSRADGVLGIGAYDGSAAIDGDPSTAYRSFPNTDWTNRFGVQLETHFDPEDHLFVPMIDRLELLPYRTVDGALVGFPAWYVVEALQGDTYADAKWTHIDSFTEQPGPYRAEPVTVEFADDVPAWGIRVRPILLGHDALIGGFSFALAELRAGYSVELQSQTLSVLP